MDRMTGINKLYLSLICILSVTTVTGCVTGEARIKCWAFCGETAYTITYYSDPSGAMLYSAGKFMGVTPLNLTYPIARKGQCQYTEPLLVRWGSGAEASQSALTLCPEPGYNKQWSFIRPTGIPGRDIDMQFAIALQRNAILQQQANAQNEANLIQAWGVISSAINTPTYNTNKPNTNININTNTNIRCTSTNVGTTVYTTCN